MRKSAILVAALAAAGVAQHAHAALTIVPTYADNINSDPNSATIKATINAAIAEYAAKFSDNITVNMTFQEGGGLGGSSTSIFQTSYTGYRAALVTHATTTNDTTALASLPVQATSPADGQANMWLTTANGRALGLFGSASTDCTITWNTSIMNLNRTTIDPNKYDLKAVAQHEIDEGLGLGSGLNLPVAFPRLSRPQDLFRYSAAGVRSYTTSSSATSYFSINGGTTNLVGFNQNSGGDYGDWVTNVPAKVQDAFGTPGSTPNLGVELTNLDVIGYSLVPEPGTAGIALITGFSLLTMRRRSAHR